jgi:hypothetical protein
VVDTVVADPGVVPDQDLLTELLAAEFRALLGPTLTARAGG